MIYILTLLIGLILLVAGIWAAKTDKSHCKEDSVKFCLGVTSIIIGVMLIIIMSTITIVTYCANVNDKAELEAFYNANVKNYASIAQKTESLISLDKEEFTDKLLSGSIEKYQQSSIVSQRLSEWRNAVNDFNTKLSKMRANKSNMWVCIVYPSVSELKFLTIE